MHQRPIQTPSMRGLGVTLSPSALAFRASSVSEPLRQAAREALAMPLHTWDRDVSGTRPYIVDFQGRSIHRADGTGRIENIRLKKDAFSVEINDTNRADLLRRWGWVTCNWSSLLVDEDCTGDNVYKFLLQTDRFLWAQLRTQQLLADASRLPALSSASATQWASWIREVYRHVALAYWATNIRAHRLTVPPGVSGASFPGGLYPRTWLAWDGPRVDAWREAMRVATREARGLPRRGTGDKAWDSGAGLRNEPYMPGMDRATSLDPNVYARPGDVPFLPKFWNLLGTIVQNTAQPTPYQFARWEEGYPTSYSSFDPFDADSFSRLVSLLSDGQSAPISVTETPSLAVQNAGRRRTRAFASPEEEAAYNSPTRTITLTGRAMVDFTIAVAEDLVLGSYIGIVMESLGRWSETMGLLPEYARTGDLDRSVTAVQQAMRENGEIARSRIQMAQQFTGSLAAMVPSGLGTRKGANPAPNLNSIIDIVYSVVSIAGNDAVQALGASSIPYCPPAVFMRQMSQPGCDSTSMMATIQNIAEQAAAEAAQPPPPPPAPAPSRAPLYVGIGVGLAAMAAFSIFRR